MHFSTNFPLQFGWTQKASVDRIRIDAGQPLRLSANVCILYPLGRIILT